MTFKVCFVYDDEVDYSLLRRFCEERSIKYKSRPFNSSKYEIDRENIIRLPAIHIIQDKICIDTVYPSVEALDAVECYYTEYAKIQRLRYRIMKRIGRWLFGSRSLKTDSLLSKSRVSTNNQDGRN
jgi:hypothetical protein